MESTHLRAVTPVRPVAAYIGGKRNLAGRLIEMIEAVPHKTYAEPFVGMGGVFFRRKAAPPAEVINDLSRDVSNLFRVLQEHYAFFLQILQFQLTTRAEFERLVATDPETLTDLKRAARFLYLQRTAFGGKVVGQNFGVSRHRGGAFNVNKVASLLEAVHERLADVVIERLPWQAFMARYDTPDTLFYLDPPYFACEGDYGSDLFDRAQFDEMAQVLGRLQGRFILSLNDRPEVREIFAGFEILERQTTYTLSGQAKPAAELIITGGGRANAHQAAERPT